MRLPSPKVQRKTSVSVQVRDNFPDQTGGWLLLVLPIKTAAMAKETGGFCIRWFGMAIGPGTGSGAQKVEQLTIDLSSSHESNRYSCLGK